MLRVSIAIAVSGGSFAVTYLFLDSYGRVVNPINRDHESIIALGVIGSLIFVPLLYWPVLKGISSRFGRRDWFTHCLASASLGVVPVFVLLMLTGGLRGAASVEARMMVGALAVSGLGVAIVYLLFRTPANSPRGFEVQ